MTTNLRNLYHDLSALPGWVWIALAVIVVGGYYLTEFCTVRIEPLPEYAPEWDAEVER
jgi:hypothetical protein